MFLINLVKALNQQNIPYALVGGHAVAIHGAVRGTMDVDLVLKWSLEILQKTEETFSDLGLIPRLPISAKDIFDFRQEYIDNRNLIAWNFYNPAHPDQQVDIIIIYDLSDLQSINIKYQETNITVIAKHDLIQMKKASGRKQDLLDVEALEKL
ncbi:hypothetical protein MNBD_GAMMA01-1662 [hydrothermal vent metagenome]|uniref:Uncharacterized protein n=1 Tax=hydrothermal vent metagenome TaxID=652676 RepID=A0A3B0V6B8_9ZZZZ